MGSSVAQTGAEMVKTYFAPPERAGEADVRQLVQLIKDNPLFEVLHNSIDGYLMILNPQRQILAVNKDLLNLLGISSAECLLGLRPGEAMNCIHAPTGPNGCGTARACATCGAAISILTSQGTGDITTGEHLLTARRADLSTESFDLRVRTTPLKVLNHEFTVLVFNDISGDKRREALERIFFHDILNTASGLVGLGSLLERHEIEDPKEIAQHIVALSQKLCREIQDQRRLSQAENGALDVEMGETFVQDILDSLRPNFEANEISKDRSLAIELPPKGECVTTDAPLLGRILTNMVKNALEAVKPGATVRVWYERLEDQAAFHVQNPGAIPEKVALQIFKRSFSTKSKKGRGIGTYSMKLFGERYLGGKVSFTTSEQEGTIFTITLPIAGPCL